MVYRRVGNVAAGSNPANCRKSNKCQVSGQVRLGTAIRLAQQGRRTVLPSLPRWASLLRRTLPAFGSKSLIGRQNRSMRCLRGGQIDAQQAERAALRRRRTGLSASSVRQSRRYCASASPDRPAECGSCAPDGPCHPPPRCADVTPSWRPWPLPPATRATRRRWRDHGRRTVSAPRADAYAHLDCRVAITGNGDRAKRIAYCIEIMIASPPRLSISPSRLACRCIMTPDSFCSQRSPPLMAPTAKP